MPWSLRSTIGVSCLDHTFTSQRYWSHMRKRLAAVIRLAGASKHSEPEK